MILFHPSLQSALVAYGIGAVLAGGSTFAMGLGDPWPLLGSGAGTLIMSAALRLMRRTFAMLARTLEELQFRRVVLGIGTLAASFGSVVFALAIIRWQFDLVSLTALWTTTAWALVNLAAAWAAVRRLASYLEPPADRSKDQESDENGDES